MKLRYLTVGFGSQIGLLTLFAVMGFGKLSETVYWPWFLLGEWVFLSGAGGHAMPGGAILGFLFGMFVLFTHHRSRDHLLHETKITIAVTRSNVFNYEGIRIEARLGSLDNFRN
jgi:hypothetical protein